MKACGARLWLLRDPFILAATTCRSGAARPTIRVLPRAAVVIAIAIAVLASDKSRPGQIMIHIEGSSARGCESDPCLIKIRATATAGLLATGLGIILSSSARPAVCAPSGRANTIGAWLQPVRGCGHPQDRLFSLMLVIASAFASRSLC